MDSAMRLVVIVLFDPASDAAPRFSQVSILCRPHFLFLQAAVGTFDVAVAFRVMVPFLTTDKGFVRFDGIARACMAWAQRL